MRRNLRPANLALHIHRDCLLLKKNTHDNGIFNTYSISMPFSCSFGTNASALRRSAAKRWYLASFSARGETLKERKRKNKHPLKSPQICRKGKIKEIKVWAARCVCVCFCFCCYCYCHCYYCCCWRCWWWWFLCWYCNPFVGNNLSLSTGTLPTLTLHRCSQQPAISDNLFLVWHYVIQINLIVAFHRQILLLSKKECTEACGLVSITFSYKYFFHFFKKGSEKTMTVMLLLLLLFLKLFAHSSLLFLFCQFSVPPSSPSPLVLAEHTSNLQNSVS